jgi:methyltransferase-like protein
MINKHIKKRLKKVIPHYVGLTKKILVERGVTNKQGKPYSDTYIMYVFSGHRNNTEIESAILEAYNRKLQEIKKLKSFQKQIK